MNKRDLGGVLSASEDASIGADTPLKNEDDYSSGTYASSCKGAMLLSCDSTFRDSGDQYVSVPCATVSKVIESHLDDGASASITLSFGPLPSFNTAPFKASMAAAAELALSYFT